MAARSPPLRSIASRISRSDTPPHKHTIIFDLLPHHSPAATSTPPLLSIAAAHEGHDKQPATAPALQLDPAAHQPRHEGSASTVDAGVPANG
jgi:hypothetical protein